MGVANRFYMRDDYHPPRVTTKLIIVLLVAFFIQSALLFYGDVNVFKHLALSVDGLRHGKIWQLFTFQFLHSAPWPWHVLLNCLGLWFFGRRVEETLGARKFLTLYLLAGVAGGLLQVLLTVLLPRHADIPVVGASAGVYGVMAIFCSLHPMEEIRTWIYFFPVTIRAYFLLLFLGLYSLYGAIIPFDGIAHGAHLGGLLLGIGYVHGRDKFADTFSQWIARFRKPSPSRSSAKPMTVGALAKNTPWKGERAEPQREPEVFISEEIDPILDKISAHGINSLTERERKLLEAARKKMR